MDEECHRLVRLRCVWPGNEDVSLGMAMLKVVGHLVFKVAMAKLPPHQSAAAPNTPSPLLLFLRECQIHWQTLYLMVQAQLGGLVCETGLQNRACFPWVSIELHTPTNSTQKPKLMRRGGQLTYTSTFPLTCRLLQVSNVEIRSRLQLFYFNRACQDSNSRPLTLIPYWVACANQLNPKAWADGKRPTIHI